ncbi:hypothetical protein K440DRAFT_661537 [Wilcoxina mikolae CBS 423.85]|nr:hypothetical protein K440DRAFT_661537 [Wilcoxina mikolae CBS 423.85]
MVQFLPLALTFLGVVGVAHADESKSEVLSKFPELSVLADKPFAISYNDPNTHQPVKEVFPDSSNVQKRFDSENSNDDRLPNLLRSNNAYNWCKTYNDGPKPYTATKTDWVITTTCEGHYDRYGYEPCHTPTTIRVVTSPIFSTITSTNTTTETDTSTSTIEAPTSTITDTTTTTTTLTSTSTAPVVTITVSMPTTATFTKKVRAVNPPSYLRGYKPWQISQGCYKINPRHTFTRTITRTYTRYARPATVTRIVTRKPHVTITTTVGVTVTTSTTVFTTNTPLTTTTSTITDTTTTVETITPTTTVCPSTTAGAFGIGVNAPGSIDSLLNPQDPAACCSWCFSRPGCNAWVYSSPGFCAGVFNAPPQENAFGQGICPQGTGDWFFLLGGRTDGSDVGGRGQCARNQL